MLLVFGCGVVGFLDDFIKVYKQNNRGLRGWAKLTGQTLVALVFGVPGHELLHRRSGRQASVTVHLHQS